MPVLPCRPAAPDREEVTSQFSFRNRFDGPIDRFFVTSECDWGRASGAFLYLSAYAVGFESGCGRLQYCDLSEQPNGTIYSRFVALPSRWNVGVKCVDHCLEQIAALVRNL